MNPSETGAVRGMCPHCSRELMLEESRPAQHCRWCRGAFEVIVIQRRLPQVEAPADVGDKPDEQGRCSRHPDNPADHVCRRCGDFVCRVCAVKTEGHVFCPKCFEVAHTRGTLGASRRAFTLPKTALGLGVLALVFGLCNIVACLALSISAIVVGSIALRRIGRQPDLPGRGKAIAAIVLGLLGPALFFVFITYLIQSRPR